MKQHNERLLSSGVRKLNSPRFTSEKLIDDFFDVNGLPMCADGELFLKMINICRVLWRTAGGRAHLTSCSTHSSVFIQGPDARILFANHVAIRSMGIDGTRKHLLAKTFNMPLLLTITMSTCSV